MPWKKKEVEKGKETRYRKGVERENKTSRKDDKERDGRWKRWTGRKDVAGEGEAWMGGGGNRRSKGVDGERKG